MEDATRDSEYQNAIALVKGSVKLKDLDHDPLAEFGEDRHEVYVKSFGDSPFLWLGDSVIVPGPARKEFYESLIESYSRTRLVFRILCDHFCWPGMREALRTELGNDCFAKK